MAEKILMLALSPTMELGTIARWNKKEGDKINSGDVLCEVETDKATMDYESITEGTLLKIVADGGARVKVGDLIAVIGEPGEDTSDIIDHGIDAEPSQPREISSVRPDAITLQQAPTAVAGGPIHLRSIKASPLAREIARRKGIDLALISGSGPGGRIVKQDVEKVNTASHGNSVKKLPQEGASGVQTIQRIPISEKRRVIAKRLSDSMFTAPHFYMTIAVGVDRIISARKALNAQSESKVSLNAFLLKIVAEVLRKHPTMLSSWNGDSIIQYGSVDIAVAVAQKDGLITPIVKDCSSKGIKAIDEELKELIGRARDNNLLPQEYSGASFTISNLGSYGIRQFTAIINPPASAILAIGEIFKEMVIDDNDNELVRSTMMLTLSCDHRVIDGAVAAEFARDLKRCLEDPFTALY